MKTLNKSKDKKEFTNLCFNHYTIKTLKTREHYIKTKMTTNRINTFSLPNQKTLLLRNARNSFVVYFLNRFYQKKYM